MNIKMRPTFIDKNRFLEIKKYSLNGNSSTESDEMKKKYVENMIQTSQAKVSSWNNSYEVIFY